MTTKPEIFGIKYYLYPLAVQQLLVFYLQMYGMQYPVLMSVKESLEVAAADVSLNLALGWHASVC